jgi:hypothetical protein
MQRMTVIVIAFGRSAMLVANRPAGLSGGPPAKVGSLCCRMR